MQFRMLQRLAYVITAMFTGVGIFGIKEHDQNTVQLRNNWPYKTDVAKAIIQIM